MEVCEADDVAGGRVQLVFIAGTIHFSYVAFVTGRKSPSSTSRNMIFSMKLERPHGSIEMGEKALR
jgi:hypothetical protein